jgi:putative MATE family efflux protein
MAETAPRGPAREQGKFVTGSLMRHVVVMSLSGAAGLSFTFLVDFLALWWISQLRQEEMIAAVGIAGAIQFAVISIAIGMMIGAVALVARSLGMGERERARRIATVAIILTTGFQAVVALVVFIFSRQILAFTGAEGAVLDMADSFLRITLPSMPFFAMGMTASAVLRAVGDAWRSMAVTMVGGLVAVVLDPVLIIWMGWGVTGAGYSIFAARTVIAVVGLWFVIGHHNMLARPSREDALIFARPYFAIAIPAIATQISTPFGNWILTREMAQFGESAVAGWGVIMRLTILAFGGIFALSGAIGGIIGQNYGAGRVDRVAEAFVAALKFCAVYTLITWALMAALTGPISSSFGLSAEGEAVVRAFTHYAAGSFIFTGALFCANAAFNNLGRPIWSTGANWFRDGLLIMPIAMTMAIWAGAEGVVWAQAAANVIAGTLAASLAWRYIGTLKGRTAAADRAPRPAE